MNGDQKGTLRSLAIGLVAKDPNWISLLDSEGLGWTFFSDTDSIEHSCELVVLPHSASAKARRSCFALARKGKTVITELHRPKLGGLGDAQSWSLPYHAKDFSALREQDMNAAVWIEYSSCGKGRYYRLPFRLEDLWSSSRTGFKYVVVDADKGTLVFHRQAWIVKKNVRRVIIEVLRRAFFERHLPLVHKWYWPGHSRSVFCFRGDLDGGGEGNLLKYLKAVQPFADCITLFCCVGQYHTKRELIKAAVQTGVEMGNHMFCHFVFPEGWTNTLNLVKAEHFLTSLGAQVRGYAGPAYFWHSSVYSILASRGYHYTSSFGLDHDNLPYYPVVNGQLGAVLEIPFHCVGDFLPTFDISLDGSVTKKFFSDLISKKHSAGEPLNLYGHPDGDKKLGSEPALVHFILEKVASHSDVWAGQLDQLAFWWARRRKVAWKLSFDPVARRLVCDCGNPIDNRNSPPAVSIHMPDGSWRLVHPLACRRPGLHIDKAEIRTALWRPRASDVGELVHVSDPGSFRQALRHKKWELERLIKKYREIYLARIEK